MQHLVVRTSHPAHLTTSDWKTNGVGRRVSHSYGYGLLDASAMVTLARNWTNVGPQQKCVLSMMSEPRNIGSHLVVSRSVDACFGRPDYVSSLEHAQAQLTLSYSRRQPGHIPHQPTGHPLHPAGPEAPRLLLRGLQRLGLHDHPLLGRGPRGEWTLEIENVAGVSDYGTLTQFTLVLYGTGSTSINPSGSDFSQPSNNSCKTFDDKQICIECSRGFLLFQQGCVRDCPPGYTPGSLPLNYTLENWAELSSVQACLPCHPTCLHQNQILRESPDGRGGAGEGRTPSGAEPPSRLPVAAAVVGCIFIAVTFAAIFGLLQLRSGGAPCGGHSKLHTLESGAGIRVGFGIGRASVNMGDLAALGQH
ncbi:hypothetical protein ANANG_G00106430 [Anguilla anguilla]|uniref:P/Homo B domain-containing protein n=1 Tax=Anguilla anguilla TaxID=7936 RepID=A0A9D3MHX6_ANGAN|nr:hypothetical protein ANANG_G00106430 [Anguilla anguilla]